MKALLHYPTFFICIACIFCISSTNFDMADAIRRCTALVSAISLLLGYCFWLLMKGPSIQIPTDKILKTFCLVGVFEILYSILQILGVINNHFHYHFFSGSFENPAILGMLLSFCISISYYYTIKSVNKERVLWLAITILMISFIVLSGSRTSLIASFSSISFISYIEIPKCAKLFKNKYFLLFAPVVLIIASLLLYFYKMDSANGRLLIWNVSYEMIKDKPFLGWGTDGFLAQYMYHQAQYFIQNPNSPYSDLASEVSFPFNEFIKCAVNYGLITLMMMILLLILTVIFIWKEYKSKRCVILSIILTLIMWGMFSYPSDVPFVWLIVLYLVLSILDTFLKKYYLKYIPIILICVCSTMLVFIGKRYYREFERISLQENALNNWDKNISAEYVRIYEHNKENYRFLYNYGAILHYHRMYKESLGILKECSKHLADYNVQLLIADNYQRIGIPDSAISAYRYASNMIPNRFLPLYYQMVVYQEQGEHYKAQEIAKTIIHKKNKIKESKTVKEIIKRANECLKDNGQACENSLSCN